MKTPQEYPKWLRHPGETAATVSQPLPPDPLTKLRPAGAPGQPLKFPPVMVNNRDDEEYYVARGYNPGTWNEAQVDAQLKGVVPAKNGKQYPMYAPDGSIIPDPDAEDSDDGQYPMWVGDKIAYSRAEELALRGSCEDEPVPSPKAEVVDRDELEEFRRWKAERDAKAAESATAAEAHDWRGDPGERQALYDLADEAGVKIDKRWSITKLRETVERAVDDADAKEAADEI